MTNKETKKSEEQQGRVTGGMWMGRMITAAQKLAYGLGHGTGAVVASGAAAIEGLLNAIHELADGHVSKAQLIGSAISKSAGAHVEKLKGLDQKPFADTDAPSLAGMLASAFSAGARDGQKEARAKRKAKGSAQAIFKEA